MAKLFKRRSKQPGLPPGTLVADPEHKTEKIRITVFDYDEKQFQEKECASIEETFAFRDTATVTWINIDGLHDTAIIQKIGDHFGIHSLVLEDILHTTQRPKFEEFDDHLFVVLKMLHCEGEDGRTDAEQVSLILGRNFVLSFQERPGDVFDPIRDRIRNAKGRIRRMDADFLAYALCDAIVDNYFTILEKLGERIEGMEETLVTNPDPSVLRTIHGLKQETVLLRKSVWPLREAISGLQRTEVKLIKKQTHIYLRDVYDHTIQVIDTIEAFRDITTGLQDLYLSSISNRMNEIMKVLTIISTIFIPLTFVAGLYGMNFKHIPELGWPYGYAFVWGVMLVIAGIMFVYFRRKKWL